MSRFHTGEGTPGRDANGGSYCRWTAVYSYGPGIVHVADDWSAEFDRLNYGGEWKSFAVPTVQSQNDLVEMIQGIVKDMEE